MIDRSRTRELERYVADWEQALTAVTAIRGRLLKDIEIGLTLVDESGKDLLPERINQADDVVKNHHAILIRMTALRDRARSGEDV